MNFGGPGFVLAIIAMSFLAWIITTAIRARHGYPLEDEWGGKTAHAGEDKARALAEENRELREQLGTVGERVKVLERIVTDTGYNVANQIEGLRDTRRVEELLDGSQKETR